MVNLTPTRPVALNVRYRAQSSNCVCLAMTVKEGGNTYELRSVVKTFSWVHSSTMFAGRRVVVIGCLKRWGLLTKDRRAVSRAVNVRLIKRKVMRRRHVNELRVPVLFRVEWGKGQRFLGDA